MAGQSKILEKLKELGRNLWWCWQPSVHSLFRELDPALWTETGHNPVEFLIRMPADQLERRAAEMALDARIDHAFRRLSEYLKGKKSWGALNASILRTRPVAYFSAEFGLHESLPIYSGGLGVLAGDHLKSASDLGIPLVGVGLLYNQGYFRQSLDANGWQQEHYLDADTELLPIEPALDAEGKPLTVTVETAKGELRAKIWRVEVGRTLLLLLDSNVPENTEDDQALTARLYGGDARTRIRQELLLGIGGVRALTALGIQPSVMHLNEGHSAFATLEMIRMTMEETGLPYGEVVNDVARMTVFTTHTPVAAGHDRFPAELVEEHLGKIREALRLSYDDFMALGRVYANDPNELYCMTVLALKLSRSANGVSALHGVVSRRMWHPLYPNKSEEQVPIGHITNGVHVQSWISPQVTMLLNNHLGVDWSPRQRHGEVWAGVDNIDDAELWETKQILKAQLITFVRDRLVEQARKRNDSAARIERFSAALDPSALTIGFARRFATYKRAGLVLQDIERMVALIRNSQRPIQFVFAGKAHPEDRMGKELIQHIVKITWDERFSTNIVFVEDYDMDVARHLVQGVDVWLNNPRRPQEASGTSGEKAVLNGTLNFSILDGWWAEAYDGSNGFAIGSGKIHAVPSVQDERDHAALIDTLTNQVVPTFYNRDADGLPREWIARQKHAFRTLAWKFNSDRMVMDYALRSYLPAAGGVVCQ